MGERYLWCESPVGDAGLVEDCVCGPGEFFMLCRSIEDGKRLANHLNAILDAKQAAEAALAEARKFLSELADAFDEAPVTVQPDFCLFTRELLDILAARCREVSATAREGDAS